MPAISAITAISFVSFVVSGFAFPIAAMTGPPESPPWLSGVG
jgi:hypothetical protein